MATRDADSMVAEIQRILDHNAAIARGESNFAPIVALEFESGVRVEFR